MGDAVFWRSWRIVDRPMPEVPPMKTAVGDVLASFEFDAWTSFIETMVTISRELFFSVESFG